MHSKSFTFGIGTGMIIVALLFYIALSFNNVQTQTDNTPPSPVSEDDIITRAKMLGMVFQDDLQAALTPPPSEIVTLTDSEIIARAEELGMKFINNGADEPDLNTPILNEPAEPEPYVQPEPEPSEQPEPEPSEPPEQPEPEKIEKFYYETHYGEENIATIHIFIPPGSLTTDIANMICEAGIINDPVSFSNYIMELNASRRLRNGMFKIPLGADYYEIASILTNGRI